MKVWPALLALEQIVLASTIAGTFRKRFPSSQIFHKPWERTHTITAHALFFPLSSLPLSHSQPWFRSSSSHHSFSGNSRFCSYPPPISILIFLCSLLPHEYSPSPQDHTILFANLCSFIPPNPQSLSQKNHRKTLFYHSSLSSGALLTDPTQQPPVPPPAQTSQNPETPQHFHYTFSPTAATVGRVRLWALRKLAVGSSWTGFALREGIPSWRAIGLARGLSAGWKFMGFWTGIGWR